MKESRAEFFKELLLLLLISLMPLSVSAQSGQKAKRIGDFIESTSYNEHLRGAERRLQYLPDGDDFVCVNGKNRYTRALYGGHSAYRFETSDYPVFVSFVDKKNCVNISFRMSTDLGSVALDSVFYCEARYNAGKRTYIIMDSVLRRGILMITALAMNDRDGAVLKFEPMDMNGRKLNVEAKTCEIRNPKLHREGDMGVEKPGSLEAAENPKNLKKLNVEVDGVTYLIVENQELRAVGDDEGGRCFDNAEEYRKEISSTITFDTPDPYINTLGGTLAVAADAIWNEKVWLHGAIGWRVQLPGWRAAYVGDVIGQHDRARTHFDAYAASQVTDVPDTIPHPSQDEAQNLARAKKLWGTQMYSNGYICRNPERNNQMNHYDMNLCYIDELLWHFNWTGDLDYVRKMWNTIKLHLAWEKRNFDPDDDGLYDAYCCIWASDALYYNGGAVTHSSSYNYRANKLAAMLAAKIGENPEPYEKEAAKILAAMNSQLWLKDKGHWAEYKDNMGNKLLHESAALYTIYHAIDNETSNPFQAYQSTRYIDTSIPHIKVEAEGLDGDDYAVLSTSNWMPYAWSINNVALAENTHTALAYFEAGRADEGFRLLKSNILDAMYLGNSPGNFAQMSFYDAARGECYRDFGDPIGITARTLIQGLYGIIPDAVNNRLLLRPGFPHQWNHAAISTPDISYRFTSSDDCDTFSINHHFGNIQTLELQVRAKADDIKAVRMNGKEVAWKCTDNVGEYPVISITVPAEDDIILTIEWGGKKINPSTKDDTVNQQGQKIEKVYDPQEILASYTLGDDGILKDVKKAAKPGHHTFFVLTVQGKMRWWKPVDIHISGEEPQKREDFNDVKTDKCRMVNIDGKLNASVTDIFENKYLSPRPPYTTLQLPVQGIGEWCHPKLTAEIDDSVLRSKAADDTFMTSIGVPFRLKQAGDNILFTSLWDNYPDSATVKLKGSASHAYLLMAGSTNPMQSRFVNGRVKIYYEDGSVQQTDLVNPDNWCPIEQDYFVDGKAFYTSSPRPYRLHFKTGKVSRDLGSELGITGVYGREIECGAGVLLDIPLDKTKKLDRLVVETVANDVVIGIMSVTLQE